MQKKFLIREAEIINEGKIITGHVLVEGGIIKEIIPGNPDNIPEEFLQDAVIIHAKGKFLLPGVIDDQVHFREPGLTYKGDICTESRAAVAGGVTSYMDMPNTNPKATTLEFLEQKYHIASKKSVANYSFFLGATNENIKEIESADPGNICGVKVFMGASTGNMLVDDPGTLENIFERSPLLVAIHSEDEKIIRENLSLFTEKYNENIPIEAHPLIRSEKACYTSTTKAIGLAKKFNTRLHILHISTGKELGLLDNSIPLEKKRITGEVCVHHLWFDDRDYKTRGSLIKWNPAIKTENDKNALFCGLLDNTIDIIATDHAPHTLEEKQNPYISSPSGAPMIQHSLVAMFEFWHRGMISVEQIVNKMCHSPAILYRIKNRGFIRKGYFADLAIVDPNSPWTVNKTNLLYKCGWSPMEGVHFSSAVTHTFVNGELVYENGRSDDSVRGMRLEFNQG